MPELHRYRLFVSHAWRYSEEYNRFCNLLANAPNFIYSNYSVPECDPLHCKPNELAEELRQQIRPVEVAIILGGMYATHSDWIQFEINFAQSLNKRILGVAPYGSERFPLNVSQASHAVVNWNTASIVDAIRKLAG
ncbi:MAG: TIR domain-containing protein [Dehalococcoides mccartyi]|uniref:TIR domain-containing protein n=1 Tax=Dehalococcoides mccartyi TaxID=61435 RepID=UPI0030FB9780